MKKWNQVLKELEDIVYVEIYSGVYICRQQDIIDDQKDWSEFNEYKEFDFTTSPYWITSDNGMYPIGISNQKEYVKWYSYWAKSDSI